jgi:hypothetical protein
MAIKLIGDNPAEQRYLKVTGLTLNTVAAVTDAANACDNLPERVDVVVHFNIYKNQEERYNPTSWSKVVPDSRTFAYLPDVANFTGTEMEKQITRGYTLLRTLDEFSDKVWEDML